ncbi:MAG: hypothetical protein E7010_02615 [Alphaproteobacteria bacterium]|nr:hypothetical protein [Alphaproteobacteria bacterium]
MVLEKKAYTQQTINFTTSIHEDDTKNFHIGNVEKNVLTDHLPERDNPQSFNDDMYNFGENDDLPDSDRIMQCQRKGISQKKCLDV